MTAMKDLEVVPQEVVAYIKAIKCPICKGKGKVANEGDDGCTAMYNNSEFLLFTCCPNDDHYNVSLAWNTPKEIHCTDEEIIFQYQEHQYKISKWYSDSGVRVDIKIFGLDELGHINDDDAKEISFNEDYFNFKRFNAKKFANLIKTLAIFR